ncbi:MAG: hypothetical protein ACD_73C00383G0001 [uncultured bacterium]|nr:MAG: hypothetical protein ACD_73C00383G0001 [uncultured bacterium]
MTDPVDVVHSVAMSEKGDVIVQPPLPWLRRMISGIRLFPKSHDFFTYFEKSSECVLSGARLLVQMIASTKENRPVLLKELKDIEHDGDKITHEAIDVVRSTFLTPFDRNDIHTFVVALDDILDAIYHIGNRLTRYGTVEITTEIKYLADYCLLGCVTLVKAVKELKNTKSTQHVLMHCHEINRIEKQSDDMINVALEKIFNSNYDPYQVIKLKELAEQLEYASDLCKKTANIIEGIILKNA